MPLRGGREGDGQTHMVIITTVVIIGGQYNDTILKNEAFLRLAWFLTINFGSSGYEKAFSNFVNPFRPTDV